jgi:hypothetical protein
VTGDEIDEQSVKAAAEIGTWQPIIAPQQERV